MIFLIGILEVHRCCPQRTWVVLHLASRIPLTVIVATSTGRPTWPSTAMILSPEGVTTSLSSSSSSSQAGKLKYKQHLYFKTGSTPSTVVGISSYDSFAKMASK